MARKVYRVLPDSGDWIVKKDGDTFALRKFTKKDDAVQYGVQTAKANQPSQLVVHRADGTIEYEYTYGQDPYPPRG